MNKSLSILGGISAEAFLQEYWQKKPLLIRQALPEFKGLLSPNDLLELASHDDAQSRLITQRGGKWKLRHGPFVPEDWPAQRSAKWTMLVQGVNHFLPSAAALLSHFSFIPHARLDDLMVSYAPKGGGVGPHFDSYDVFLLQGQGHRRWQISAQSDRTLIKDAPLRILQNFHAEQEWVLEAGDMLYLPPQYAHNGIAEDDCMTYSIGFRTPAFQELAEQFLVYLQDRVCMEGMYADPDLKLQSSPAEISSEMVDKVENVIQKIRWDKQVIAQFLGSYLSEPKPHIYFDAPEPPLSRAQFKRAVHTRGIVLDLKSTLLCYGNTVFINGNACEVDMPAYIILRELADNRRLAKQLALSENLIDLIYEWYLDGYCAPAASAI